MTFIDIPYRFAVKAACTNRKCNNSDFGRPISGFAKKLWAHLIGHPRLVVGVFYDFCLYILPFSRKGYLFKPEMKYFRFWGPHFSFCRNFMGSLDWLSSICGGSVL